MISFLPPFLYVQHTWDDRDGTQRHYCYDGSSATAGVIRQHSHMHTKCFYEHAPRSSTGMLHQHWKQKLLKSRTRKITFVFMLIHADDDKLHVHTDSLAYTVTIVGCKSMTKLTCSQPWQIMLIWKTSNQGRHSHYQECGKCRSRSA